MMTLMKTQKMRGLGWLGAALVAVVAIGAAVHASGRAERGGPVVIAADAADDPGSYTPGFGIEVDGAVRVTPDLARALGVVAVEAELGAISHAVRTTGHVTYDETRLSMITAKFGGFIERLHVDKTGQLVRRGQPVLDIYSPALVVAQEELLTAVRLEERLRPSMAPDIADRGVRLAESARQKLRLWDISQTQIEQIEEARQVRRNLTLYSPSTGFVVEKLVQAGQAIDPGMPLYRLADLSTVWVEADIFEQDLRFVRLNATVHVEIDAYPGPPVAGRVSYIYPDVRQETRTARVRIALSNPGGRIMPGMYATVHIDAISTDRAVLVPRDAVLRSGTRSLVFVERGTGVFEPRTVVPGAEGAGRTQILSGLLAGERVVSRASFLLDAESRLMEDMEEDMGDKDGMPGMDEMSGMKDIPRRPEVPGMRKDVPTVDREVPPNGLTPGTRDMSRTLHRDH